MGSLRAVHDSGRPLVANDPHLALGEPSTFYPIHLTAGNVDIMGSGFAGVPFVIVGQTRNIAWGATVSPLDVTDVFQEQVVPDATSPSGLSTIYHGTREPVIPIPETYRVNNIGDGVLDNLSPVPPGGSIPAVTLIVPRRNNGPIVQLDPATGVAISIQYTGFSGTRELDTFWTLNRAQTLDDFMRGLQWFDSGTQNFAYADIAGNIAYFATSEVPVREDLQNGTVTGLPPWFIRNGTGGNEWLPIQNPQPGQAIPYEVLPASEMPHLVNPPAGWFVNANNDPAGTVLDNNPLNQLRPGGGLYYLNAGYDAGLRAGRITELLKAKLAAGPVSFGDMQTIQADVVLPDAQFFVPFITQALARATVSSPTRCWPSSGVSRPSRRRSAGSPRGASPRRPEFLKATTQSTQTGCSVRRRAARSPRASPRQSIASGAVSSSATRSTRRSRVSHCRPESRYRSRVTSSR